MQYKTDHLTKNEINEIYEPDLPNRGEIYILIQINSYICSLDNQVFIEIV